MVDQELNTFYLPTGFPTLCVILVCYSKHEIHFFNQDRQLKHELICKYACMSVVRWEIPTS